MNLTDQEKADFKHLLDQPSFLNFLSRVIQLAGIYDPTANGSAERTFRAEGRRNLGLDILRMVDAAQPAPGQSHPTLTLIQVLVAEAQSPRSERTKSGRRNGIYNDLDGSDDGNDSGNE